MKLSKIKKNPNNPRLIRDEKFERLKRSLKEFPQMMNLRPIVIDEAGVILGGNMRFEALKANGLKEIPDEWVKRAEELTDDEKARFVITDNSSFGEYDWELIANEWTDYPLEDWGLDVPGFEAVAPEPVDEDEDSVAETISKAKELQAKWQTASGQLWKLGEHRLLCGDSTKAEDVARVMEGEKANAVVTDPPYGIGVDKRMHNDGGRQNGKAAAPKKHYDDTDWDSSTPDQSTIDALLKFAPEVVLWGGNYFNLPPARCYLVWDKQNDGNDFADCELAWTNLDKPVRMVRHMWNGMLRKDKEERLAHPTQKPVGVLEWAIGMLSDDASVIFDAYAGSGTTIIACEQLNRKCRAVEIAPEYVAVALERWANYTGKTPELITG